MALSARVTLKITPRPHALMEGHRSCGCHEASLRLAGMQKPRNLRTAKQKLLQVPATQLCESPVPPGC